MACDDKSHRLSVLVTAPQVPGLSQRNEPWVNLLPLLPSTTKRRQEWCALFRPGTLICNVRSHPDHSEPQSQRVQKVFTSVVIFFNFILLFIHSMRARAEKNIFLILFQLHCSLLSVETWIRKWWMWLRERNARLSAFSDSGRFRSVEVEKALRTCSFHDLH